MVAVMAAAMVAAVAVPVSAQPVSASRHALCRKYQHIAVKTRSGTAFAVRNDFWGTNGFCLRNSGLRPNFKVTRSDPNTINGRVMSFPYILRGCSWGVCTAKARLPARVSALRKPEASWRARTRAPGQWNASLELWFAKHRMRTGQADGAELMIWLKTRNLPKSSLRVVRIDHTKWYLVHWVASGQGRTWNYIQFRRVRPVKGVSGLRLWPFIKKSEQMGWVRPADWMLNIEAGFEIWSGGKGLGTKSFWAQP
jgi:Glycosyl hydrolase family 12